MVGARPSPVRASGHARRLIVVALTLIALVAALWLSVALGVRSVSLGTTWQALTNPIAGNVDHQVIRDQRIPRTVIGLLAGAALGVAGALAQGITRNPLADPGLLGLNAGASLGMVLAAAVAGITSPSTSVWFAFAGAALAAVVVFSIGHASPVHIALAGATITALLTPITTLILFRDVQALDTLRFWAVGSLTGRDLETVARLWPFLAVGAVIALVSAKRLNGMALGDDVAAALGQRVGVTRALAGAGVVTLAGTATALAGPIALVGLAVPHAARRIVGADYRAMVPLCAALGAIMLLAADVIGRLVRDSELEAGVVASLIGAPVLIAVARGRRVASL